MGTNLGTRWKGFPNPSLITGLEGPSIRGTVTPLLNVGVHHPR